MQNTRSKNITFRVDVATHRRLQQLAERAGETSVHTYVRRLAMAELNDEYKCELLQSLEQLYTMGMGMRHDLAKTLEVILLNVAGVPKDQVAKFIQENLVR